VRAWRARQQPYIKPPRSGAWAWKVHADCSVEEEHVSGEHPEPIPAVPRMTGHTTGTVRMWNDEEGWGVADSEQTPGGCWAHYSDIIGGGYRTVPVGATVVLDWEQVADQDGYRYRATRIEQQPS
jgi:cold shock CspA family protein